MEVERLAEGLWRWTTAEARSPGCPHGRPDASVYLETPDAVVLVDPGAPADGTEEAARFWRALDRDVARLARPVVVLLTRPRHARATAAILDRYAGAAAWTPAWSSDGATPFAARRFVAEAVLPGGVVAHRVTAAGGEAAYVLPARGGVVVGDAVTGDLLAGVGLAGGAVGIGAERLLPAHGPVAPAVVSRPGGA